MKTKNLKYIFIALAAMLVSSCGLQVRDNPTTTTGNPVINNPGTPNPPVKTYTVGGFAWGVTYDITDPVVPTGYFTNLPQEVALTINGEVFILDHNNEFTFDERFESGEDYVVGIVDNSIPIANIDGVSPPVYFNCEAGNTTGTIIDQDVTNVVVKCWISDTPI